MDFYVVLFCGMLVGFFLGIWAAYLIETAGAWIEPKTAKAVEVKTVP